jgi:DNA-binding XRE family transcriptional regulator
MPKSSGIPPKVKGATEVLIDHAAAQRIREMREAQGYSPESLAAAIKAAAADAPWGERGAVDAHTIRRIEKHGHVPGPRVQFVLANYFGLTVHELWEPRASRVAA